MISFSTAQTEKKNMFWTNKKFVFFSNAETEKKSWRKLVKTSDEFVI